MSKIKAVTFDYGGVLELNAPGNDNQAVAEIIGVSYEEFRTAYFQNNHLANVQDMSYEDMVVYVASLFDGGKEKETQIRSTLQARFKERRLNTELIGALPNLKRQGFKTGILSNYSAELRPKLKDEGILEMMDCAAISGEIGFQKPDKEAFQVLFNKLNVLPEELIFIDDSPKSLEKAGEIGYVPILFKDNKQLESDLEQLGVRLF